jgi:hypothetical protein
VDTTSLILNLFSLTFSGSALVVSVFVALRQLRLMQHANRLPVVIDLFREFRSEEFQAAERYVRESLAVEHGPSHGLSRLPEHIRRRVTTVAYFYQNLGYLFRLGILDEEVLRLTFDYRVVMAWRALEPYVRAERGFREEEAGFTEFLASFERMAKRIEKVRNKVA